MNPEFIPDGDIGVDLSRLLDLRGCQRGTPEVVEILEKVIVEAIFQNSLVGK